MGDTGQSKPRILLCFSGSVATVKIPELYLELSKVATVKLLASSHAATFFLDASKNYKPDIWEQFLAVGGDKRIIPECLEWSSWEHVGDPVVHIQLRQWADILLIAPMSADLMSKIACGISDTLLLSVVRAWHLKKKPIVVCPAMNTEMFRHPTTESALQTFQTWGYTIVRPVSKLLACNEEGEGALADVSTIVDLAVEYCSAVNISSQEHVEFLENYFKEQEICSGSSAGAIVELKENDTVRQSSRGLCCLASNMLLFVAIGGLGIAATLDDTMNV